MYVRNFSFLACLEMARLVRLVRLARLAKLARLAMLVRLGYLTYARSVRLGLVSVCAKFQLPSMSRSG